MRPIDFATRNTSLVAVFALLAVAITPGCGKKKKDIKPIEPPAELMKNVTTPKAAEAPAAATSAAAGEEDEDKDDRVAIVPPGSKTPPLKGVPRAAFNRIAAELCIPVFWIRDANKNGALDADEIAGLWGYGTPDQQNTPYWAGAGHFTPPFNAAFERIAAHHKSGGKGPKIEGEEGKRQAAIRKELAQGRPTLIRTTTADIDPKHAAFARAIVDAATIIENIYARQRGVVGMDKDIAPEDHASRMVFHRNQGPWCVAPKTEKDPACTASARKPARLSGMYPAGIQADAKFCEKLEARKDARQLMHQFHAVKDVDGKLKAVPYHIEYGGEMRIVADRLDVAAAAMAKDPKEKALVAYLKAAAKAFRDDSWPVADEAWSKMNARNSKWYLRIGPDETYFEPCSRKAGFHVSFARINQDSLRWQDKLDPIKTDMENALAALAGAPYKAREVSFHLPDFIDMVINAADSRSAHGATIGQSLPNWGPVANEGRGRTVAMTNLYTDPDSIESFKTQAASLICKDTLATISFEQEPQVMSTVLHEAAHNLGPAHEYKVDGKTDDEIFGGPLASTLEELKAQTAALWLNGWLRGKGKIDTKLSHSGYARDVLWAFGHISRGMYNSRGKPKPYSQLAAIQVGYMLANKAVTWHADQKAANGTDVGCLSIDYAAFEKASVALMKRVAGIKARGDKADALALRKEFVDDDGAWKTLRGKITERWLRSPKATFVYSVDL